MFDKVAKLARELGVVVSAALVLVAVAVATNIVPLRAQLAAPETWLGTSTGSTNAPSVAVHNVGALGDLLGVPLRFITNNVNNGATTLTIRLDSGGTLGPVNILKPGVSTGLTALIGNELQLNQITTVTYDGTQFECGGCLTTVPAGTVQDYSGVSIPTGWLKADGSAISRTSNSVLFNALAFTTVSATTVSSNTSITIAGINTSNFQIGWFVGGTNAFCNATITGIPDSTHITVSNNSTASGSTTLTVGPYAQGDCATTFNVPNYTGRATAGVDGVTNITATTCTNSASIGDKSTGGQPCGTQTQTLTLAQLPAITSGNATQTINVSTSGITSVVQNAAAFGAGTGGVQAWSVASGSVGAAASTGVNSISVVSNNTFGNAHPILGPVALVYKIVKT